MNANIFNIIVVGHPPAIAPSAVAPFLAIMKRIANRNIPIRLFSVKLLAQACGGTL